MVVQKLAVYVFSAIVLTACTQPPAGGGPADPGGDQNIQLSGDQQADWGKILQLEEQAKALARKEGCTSSGQCRTAPVGSRACGGPRYYLVYCARTADSAALFRKLDEVARAEQAFNTRYQLASTCEFRMPPTVGLTGGACVAK